MLQCRVDAAMPARNAMSQRCNGMDETGEHTLKNPRSIILTASARRSETGQGSGGMGARMIAVGVALCVACQEPERQMPPAKLAGGRVVDLIPLSLSGETWQDAEPFLALYASNPKLMAASAF